MPVCDPPAEPVAHREVDENQPDHVGPDDRRIAEEGREEARGADLDRERGGARDEDDRAEAHRRVYARVAAGTSACSRSATRSSIDSIPTERRTRFFGGANGASAVDAWVIRAGTSIIDSTPPSDSASFQIFVRVTSSSASSS